MGIGRISYSLYLWHFPLFAFARNAKGNLSSINSLLVIGAAFLLAILSYFFVEKPTRAKNVIPFIYLGSGVAAVAIVLLGIGAQDYLSNGVVNGTGRIELLNTVNKGHLRVELKQDGKVCHSRSPVELCSFVRKGSTATVVSLGDSFVDVLGIALSQATKIAKMDYVHNSQSGCPWIDGMTMLVRSAIKDVLRQRCNDLQDDQRRFVETFRSESTTNLSRLSFWQFLQRSHPGRRHHLRWRQVS